MNVVCKRNIRLHPANVGTIYDSVRTINKLNSNIPINFEILSECPLPNNAKIDILETKFEYQICKVDKKILVNGHNVDCTLNSIKDKICLNKSYINLVHKNCSNLILSIVENISFDFKIKVKVKAIAYIDNCRKVFFEAFGEGEDHIKSILLSNVCAPNMVKYSQNIYLKFDNDIMGMAYPEFLFLSPIYDCDLNIDFLLGNAFLNYIINLDITSLISSDLNLPSYK
ncbi:hypothetical protein [Romboutsia sp.]|uniref:hypothetical protein n=1 Tax=Romboutsia sp. TaxID=1965302 RepID=UPI002C1228AB|nr:hypothetical protein [Romboutsia sp.]HSQ90091.1 hypothetical protein [Romboutsia sp.]